MYTLQVIWETHIAVDTRYTLYFAGIAWSIVDYIFVRTRNVEFPKLSMFTYTPYSTVGPRHRLREQGAEAAAAVGLPVGTHHTIHSVLILPAELCS